MPVESNRTIEIMKPTTLDGVEYPGPDRISGTGQVVVVDGAIAKRLHAEGKVRVIINGDNPLATGCWDEFRIEGRRAFSPWPEIIGNRGSPDIPEVPRTRYDRCWIPVISRQPASSRKLYQLGDFGEPEFYPFSLVQRLPIRGSSPRWEESMQVIALPEIAHATQHERLVYS